MQDDLSLSSLYQPSDMEIASKIADSIAGRYVFADNQERVAKNSRKSRFQDLKRFTFYLSGIGEAGINILPENLFTKPETWKDITYGIITGYIKELKDKGYAIATINRHLATLKGFIHATYQAGYITEDQYNKVRLIKGYSHKQGIHVDQERAQIRKGLKKSMPTDITDEQARQLIKQPDTLQGRRDQLIMCLLIKLGLRVGEIAQLKVENFNTRERTLRFYRSKVDKFQTHELKLETYYAVSEYLHNGGPTSGPLLYAMHKNGTIRTSITRGGKEIPCHMSIRAIEERISVLGQQIGIEHLYPHDLRHYWAKDMTKHGTPLHSMIQAGGWKSPAMPLRYVKDNEIANEGVILGSDVEERL